MKSPSELEHGHTPEAIAARLSSGPRVSYLHDFVYGGIDGAVTTFAIVAGVVGANLSTGVVLVLGAANLLADGFSMAASNYSATKAEKDDTNRIREMEKRHIQVDPDGEREEIRQIFAAKGFAGDDLETAVNTITASRTRWIDTMLTEEHGRSLAERSPMRGALATFAAFIVCGGVPLLPFIFGAAATLPLASALTALVFFGIGSMKSRWSTASWWYSGLETLTIGVAAAALAYTVGDLLSGLV